MFLDQTSYHFLGLGLVQFVLAPDIMVLTISCPDNEIRLDSLFYLDKGLF